MDILMERFRVACRTERTSELDKMGKELMDIREMERKK